MPVVLFTAEEICASLLESMRYYSDQIVALADLDKKPLDPGESPDARRHKIAKLGKLLAEVCVGLDDLVKRAHARQDGGPSDPAPEGPPEPNRSQAN